MNLLILSIIIFIAATLFVGLRLKDHSFSFKKAPFLALSLLFVVSLLSGCSDGEQATAADTELEEAHTLIEELEETVKEKEDEIDELSVHIEDLEEQLDTMETNLRDEVQQELEEEHEEELSSLNEKITEKDDNLSEKDNKISKLEDEVSALNEDLETAKAEASTASAPTESSSGSTESESSDSCAAGSVKINSASESELQAIYEIGPDRAAQIIQLRPFSSYSDMKRISGIADARAQAIENQGIVCFD